MIPAVLPHAAGFGYRRCMGNYLAVAAGSALGGVLGYWLSGLVAQRFGEVFPLGTLIVNVTGSFLIGFTFTVSGPEGRRQRKTGFS